MSDTSSSFYGEIPTAAHFLFQVDGVPIGVFTEVGGLEVTVETVPYREGGENDYVRVFPNGRTWPNITMKRGITESDNLFAWIAAAGSTDAKGGGGLAFMTASGKVERGTGVIVAMASDDTMLRSWKLQGVMPVKWTGPKFDSSGSTPLTEEITIAHAGFTVKTHARGTELTQSAVKAQLRR